MTFRLAPLAFAVLPWIAAAPGCAPSPQPVIGAVAATDAKDLEFAYASQPASRGTDAAARVPAGSRIEVVRAGGARRTLSAGFSAAGTPCPSFDATHLLFAGRASEAEFDAVWEVGAAGGAPRKVASLRDGDCSSPAYLPHGEVVFCGPAPGGRGLWVASLDGIGPPRRITFFAHDETLDPTVLADGRLLFAVRDAAAPGAPAGPAALFAVSSDGTGVHGVHGDGAGGLSRRRPRATADRGIVFVASPLQGSGTSGVLRLDARRPARAPSVAAEGEYRSADPLPGGAMLVSRRPRQEAGAPAPAFGLALLTAGGTETVLAGDPSRDEVDAVALVARPAPKGHLSVVNESRTTGVAYCIDVRLDRTAAPGTTAVPAALRVLEEVASAAPGGPRGTRALGEAPIADDGSFFVELPADRALRLVTLGADGSVLRDSGPRFWVRPNESIGCIGCHEQPGAMAPNAQPAAVRSPPARFGAADAGEAGR